MFVRYTNSSSEIMIEQRRDYLDYNLDGRMSPKDAGREWSSKDFDGTTVLCRVCGDKASGFHYGVHSCEGCKGFFRRSIQQKIQYRPCTKNQQCSILRVNRNRCQYCRLKKCIAVGMSRDAVRFGRVPKREKAKILAAMQSVNARSQEKALAVELEDENKLVLNIVTAHIETCDYTKDKMVPLIQAALENPVYTHCTPQLACPLNPNPHMSPSDNQILQDFSDRFSPAIRGVVEFAKRIPGFGLLSQDDQVTLLKAGVFEVLLVRLACMFDSRASTMICLNGQVLKRESLLHSSNARFLMDSMFDFAERMNTLHLADGEVGIFCAVVVIAADRPGLRNVELVEKMQDKLMQALQTLVSQGHPETPSFFQELMKKIPDLRTLNTLHSEKLLAYKMDPNVEKQHQTEASASASTNMHALYQTHVGHWGTYGLQHQTSNGTPPSEDSKGSWEDHETLGASHLMRGSNRVESMPWGQLILENKDQDMYCSPRSSDNGSFAIDDVSSLKSLPSSVSSVKGADNESVCSGELVNLTSSRKRRKDNHDGVSSGDESLIIDSLNDKCPYKIRKLDSPTDSGIESGKDLGGSGTSGSRSNSICSSPRSSMEDKVKDISDCEAADKMESIEDMPVLKRALQAPPLINTNLLMDEAYKPHKKFRALRKDSDSTPTSPDIVAPTSVSPHCPHSLNASLASSHSMLVKSLEQGPRMSEQQQKNTDIIRNIIMRSDASQNNMGVLPMMSQQHQYNGAGYAMTQASQQSTQLYNTSKSGIPLSSPAYYIPQNNGNVGSAYPASTASSTWSTFGSAAQPTTITSSCSPAQTRPSYVPVSSSMQQMTATVSILPATPTMHSQYQTQQQQQMQQASSPGLTASPLPRMYYNPRSSASASPNLAATPQSPISVVISQAPKLGSPKPTSPMAGQILEHFGGCRTNGDSQPLNLSKKLSPSPPPTHHLATLQTMERTISIAAMSHMQRVKLEAS